MYAPWWIWTLALTLCASLAIAFGAALGNAVGIVTFAVSGFATCYALITSAFLIEIDGDTIRVAKAHMSLQFCGVALPLTPSQARERRGPKADPACHLTLRGWISTAVTIEVTDPNDPTPYWFVSSRHPSRLVEALTAAKS
ncbi:MAG TPA: DUF3093 domain-containing protein [Candidatus Nanopelagicaceae bacterium]|nr:DUF3093 domain-containing protein [Candidatus Nanopelagicaceae bacterium]